MGDQSMLDPALAQLGNPRARKDPGTATKTPTTTTTPIRPTESWHNAGQPPDDILQDYSLAEERAQVWSGPARFGFNAMLAAPSYKNKLRLKPDKLERIVFFLTTPDAKSREKDRADAQAKHQAQQWLYRHGCLYRNETRLASPRRHVAADEVFDVLTAEHLLSGHHGRDKMLKVLEAKYIGYTKDELMYVLDHCRVCSAKHIRGAAARRRENKQGAEPNLQRAATPNQMTSTLINDPE